MAFSSLQHRYSYSGADAKAYAYFTDNQRVQLEAMHTISFSIFEAKGRVRSLGFKSIRGFTRAVREISGTMIMLVVEDHPLGALMKLDPNKYNKVYGGNPRSWSIDAENTAIGARKNVGPSSGYFDESQAAEMNRRAPTTLSPFNIMIQYNTEVPDAIIQRAPGKNAAGGSLVGDPVSAAYGQAKNQSGLEKAYGIPGLTSTRKDKYTVKYGVQDGVGIVELIDVEIMGQGIVTSVNDMVTEVQYQFVARDYREFMLEKEAIEATWEKNFTSDYLIGEADAKQQLEILRSYPNVEFADDGTFEIKIASNLPMSQAAFQSLNRKIVSNNTTNTPSEVSGGGISNAASRTRFLTAKEIKTKDLTKKSK